MRHFLLFFAMALVWACNLNDPDSQNSKLERGIQGRIVDQNGRPMRGVYVRAEKIEPLSKRSAQQSDSALTDANGNFQMEVEPGTYDVLSESNSSLVSYTPNVVVSDTVVTLEDTIKMPGKVEAKFVISLAKRSSTASANLDQGSCFIPRVTPVYRSDENGVCEIPEVPEGKHKVVLEFPKYLAASESVEVNSGNTASMSKVLESDPNYTPPTPKLLSAKINQAAGIVTLNWSSVKVSDLAGYTVYRNFGGETTPFKLNKNEVTDTSYNDTVVFNADSVVLEYRIKSYDADLNISENFSNKLRVVVYRPSKYKTVFDFKYPKKVSIGDTFSIVANLRNDVRKNLSIEWKVGDSSILRQLNGNSDSITLDYDSPKNLVVKCIAVDDAGDIWMDSISINVGIYPPQVNFGTYVLVSRNPFLFQPTVTDEVGNSLEFSWDIDADGDFDTVTNLPQLEVLPVRKGSIVLKVRDDDNNVVLDTGYYVAYTTISGIISKDTTLTEEFSPYFINATIDSGVTLTVEAGCEFELEGYGLQIKGNIVVNGTAQSPVKFYRRLNPHDGITFHRATLPTNSKIDYAIVDKCWFTYRNDGGISSNRVIEVKNTVFKDTHLYIPPYVVGQTIAASQSGNQFLGQTNLQTEKGFLIDY